MRPRRCATAIDSPSSAGTCRTGSSVVSRSPDSETSRPSTHRVRAVESSTAQCSPTDVICTSWSSSTGGSCHLAATVSSSAASTRATEPVLGVYAKSTPAGSTEVTAPGTEVEHGVGVAVEVGESGGGRRPHLAVGGDHHAITREGEGGVVGRHGHRLGDRRRRGVDDADARAVAVEHQHRRPLLHDLGARAARLDHGVELEHGRVRPAHRLQPVVRHPDRRVAEVDALGRVAAGCHGHARDDGDHGGHRTRGHERRPMCAQRREAHHPTPASTSTQRSALGTPDLPSRVTVTVAQIRSPSSTFVSKRGSRCIGRGSPSTVTM